MKIKQAWVLHAFTRASFVSLLYVSPSISSNQRLEMTILKLYGGRELSAMFIFVFLFFFQTAYINFNLA